MSKISTELPRERLVRDGVDALSLQELIAILLGTGTKGKTVFVLAQELILQFGGAEGLFQASIEELTRVKGIGRAKAIALKAALGISQRTLKERETPRKHVGSVAEAAAIARGRIGSLEKEALLVILRDTKCRLIHCEVIAVGTLSEVLVHPREVFQPAVRLGAYSIIVCHNHPSGDPTPSQADIRLTKQLAESARIMGIALVDHLIIGQGEQHVSLRKLGHLAV